ncbi:protein kintoun [Rhinoraja longicauda]
MAASGLEELQLSRDEVDRFSCALKDEKFRQLLCEYAEEISRPENKKKYEEEITQLERERGVDVKFVHPSPGHVLKSSAGGDKKCFINVCSNELINKPACQGGRGGDGAPGQHWELPYSLTPAREDVGPGGRKHLIYDVVFHPDTLYMAGRNKRFRNMVDGVALDAVEKQLDAKLDMKNVKTLKMKYKGLPHAAVIRTPLPGGDKEDLPEEDGPLKFPYPYGHPKAEGASRRSEVKGNSTTGRPKAAGKDTPESKFTQPKYSIVYRSTVDMQDYRYARDAVPSTRPKQLVVTIDLPLLNSAESACLDVTEKLLCLESKKPAYKLELALPYPVDENQGSAKFNKSKRQLVVTLPVIPAKPELEVENNHNGDLEPARKDSDSTESEQSLLKPELNQVEDDFILKNAENDTAGIKSEDGCKDSNWDQSQNKEHLEVSHVAASDASGIKVTPSISSPNDVIVAPQIVSEVDYDGHQNPPEEDAVTSRDNIYVSLENRCSSTEDGQTNEHPQVNSSANTKCYSEGSLKENEPVCPDFHYHQDESTVTFILQVRNIKQNSLKSVLQTYDYRISFGTTDSDSLYSLIIQFPSDYQLNTKERILKVAEDNAVVVLIKSLESRGLWQSFCAGHTDNSLQNKLFVTSENADQFLSTSLRDSVPNDAVEECLTELSVSEVHESGLVISCKFQQQENDEISSDAHDLNHSTPCSTPSNTQQHEEEIRLTETIATDKETEKETSLADDGVECVPSQSDELATLSGNCDNFAQLHGSSEGSVIIPSTQMNELSLSSCTNAADGNKPTGCAKVEATDDEVLDEDDLTSDQMNDNDSEFVKQMPPLQVLEEVHPTDESIKIIYDHTTHSAFTFQNPELFQLD